MKSRLRTLVRRGMYGVGGWMFAAIGVSDGDTCGGAGRRRLQRRKRTIFGGSFQLSRRIPSLPTTRFHTAVHVKEKRYGKATCIDLPILLWQNKKRWSTESLKNQDEHRTIRLWP